MRPTCKDYKWRFHICTLACVSMISSRDQTKVAIIAGCRTPFCKAGGSFKERTAFDLSRHAVVELIQRTNLQCDLVEAVYFGQVVASPTAPNLAREISLLPHFTTSIPAATLNRACASGNEAIAVSYDKIERGYANVIIAGGAESLSNVPVFHSRRLSQVALRLKRLKSAGKRTKLLATLRPRDLVPVAPALVEPSTGESMGQSADRLAKIFGISRDDQDRFALRSHRLANAGTRDGRVTSEIAAWLDSGEKEIVLVDDGIRPESSLDQMAKLPPLFDKTYGTVTAATSSPLTDGASALLLMNAEYAASIGYSPLAFIRSYAVVAADPTEQPLMGPAYAVPKALERAGIQWSDIGLVEMHEAFASQVLATLNALESKTWAERHLGMNTAVGTVNWEAFNVMGGSIAIGHPFGASGGRITITLANEMVRRDVQFGLLTVCAQGGMGFAMVLERK